MKKVSVSLVLFLLASMILLGGGLQEKKVDLNRANEEQLQELPGIGPALAKRIIDHRAKNGPFKKVADLLNVRGIGNKKFESLEKYLTLGTDPKGREGAPKQGKSGPPTGRKPLALRP